MEKIKRTIDDIFEMSDSRYSLVNAISRKAREIADEAESNNDVLYRKPVNMVIDRLLDGRATIQHIEETPADDGFAEDERRVPVEQTVPVYAELAEEDEESEERGEESDEENYEDDEDTDREEDA